jgi:hypothetical protein
MVKHGFITYKYLWTIFKPGKIWYISRYGHPGLLNLTKTAYDQSSRFGPFLDVHCSYVEYDGTFFGKANHVIRIREKTVFGIESAARITGLLIFPREFLQGGEDLEERLLQRGRRFNELQGVQVMRYSGKYEYLKLPPQAWYDPSWRYYDSVWPPEEVSPTCLSLSFCHSCHPISLRRTKMPGSVFPDDPANCYSLQGHEPCGA